MSMKSKIFDSFLLYASFNFFTLKRGIWKHRLAFSVQHPRMIPKWWCFLCFGLITLLVHGSSEPQDCACCPHKRYLAHRVDHPGWFRGKLALVFDWVIWWTSDANPGRILDFFFPYPSSFCFLVSFSFSLYFKLFFTLIYDVVFWCCFLISIFDSKTG